MVAVIRVSAATPSINCFGKYKKVAVMMMESGSPAPRMISNRAKGCKKILWISGFVSVGKTDRCAYAKAIRYATALADAINFL